MITSTHYEHFCIQNCLSVLMFVECMHLCPVFQGKVLSYWTQENPHTKQVHENIVKEMTMLSKMCCN